MGQSTDAIVFYGYIWDDEDALIDFDLYDAVNATMAARGISNPWDDRPEGVSHREWADAHQPEIDAWRTMKQAVEDEFLVDVGRHCSDPAPMPYVFVRSTEITASRGNPKPLTQITVDPAWKGQLDTFLAECEVEPPEGDNQPGWWTCSWWG